MLTFLIKCIYYMYTYLHHTTILQMETLKTNNINKHSTKKPIIVLLLAAILSWWASSCHETTQKDVNNQKHKIEVLSLNISNYINARKKLANEYNSILAYPKTEANKYEIDNHLYLLEQEIFDYDEKIRDLIEDKINAEYDLSERIGNMWTTWIHSPIDPNKWDYLLAI